LSVLFLPTDKASLSVPPFSSQYSFCSLLSALRSFLLPER
jgi:hypothetical protein